MMSQQNIKPEFSSFYYFYYCKTGVLTSVSHRLFKKVSQPVLQIGKSKIKLFNCNNRKLAYNTLKKFVAECDDFDVESLADVKDLWTFLKVLVEWLPKIGKAAKAIGNLRKYIFPLLQVIRSCCNLTTDISINSLVSLVLDFLSLYECMNLVYNAESLDAVVLAGVSYLLPKDFSDFLKRMTLFSNVKLADDVNLFYQFFNYFFDFVFEILNKFNAPAQVSSFLYKTLDFLKISSSHLLVYELEAILIKWNEEKRIILDSKFVERVKFLDDKLSKEKSIPEWSRKSQSISDVLTKWSRLVKIVKNSEKVNRVEPNCFILEGPPGCKKSYLSNLLCQAIREPVYAHMVKAVADGKDWYDNYNNEPVFFMDDVGAQGVSQWRTMINMVSCVKMPLDCAQAELKDTKYFNSTTIVLTTNKFMSLNDITKQDCISDVTALYRRGYVFDMTKVGGSGDWMSGTIVFRHFDIKSGQWTEGFPKHFKTGSFDKIPSRLAISETIPRTSVVAWMLAIVKKFTVVKEEFSTLGELSTSELEQVVNDLESYGVSDDKYFDTTDNYTLIADNTQNEAKKHLIKYDVSSESVLFDIESDLDSGVFSKIFSLIKSRNWFLSTLKDIISECFSYFFDEFILVAFDNTKSFIFKQNKGICDWFCLALGGFVVLIFIFGCILKYYGIEDITFYVPSDEGNVFHSESYDTPFKFDCSVSSVFSAFFDVKILVNNKFMVTKGFFSGNKIVLPFHSLLVGDRVTETYRIIVYSDIVKDKRIIDFEKINIIYFNEKDDVAVVSLPASFPTPFKNRAKWFDRPLDNEHKSFLVNNEGVISLMNINVRPASQNIYSYFDWHNSFNSNDVAYDFRGKGLCGSLIFHEQQGFSGMHVAGCTAAGVGIGKIWTQETRRSIYEALLSSEVKLPFKVVNHRDDNSSVMRLAFCENQSEISKEDFEKLQASVPAASKLVTTPLYGIYPVSRFPAQLQRFGRCTVKDVAKKSFVPLKPVPEEEVQFAIKTLEIIIPEYSTITEQEVVGGNSMLAGLNKKSSNGFGCLPNKEDYIDFENNRYQESFREEITKLEAEMRTGKYPWKQFIWVESLKDELRGVEKDGVPRSFRVGTIHQQVLAKKYLGDMVQKLMEQRDFNGIMVGMNPFIEWHNLATKLSTKRIFAADVKLWDGGMLVQAQRAVADVLLSKFKGTNGEKTALSIILESLIHSLLLVQDDLFLTTHSLPSGHFLTAIFNSLVNRFYTAMWYHRCLRSVNRPIDISVYFIDVLDFVYGDDKVVGVANNTDVLTARTMRDFFESIGLGLTTSDKKTIDFDFQSLDDIDFLKRRFVFHPKLQKYMCPLDLRTLQSGLSFVASDKDMNLVISEKINNCQREYYLHENADKLLLDLYSRLDAKGYPYLRLPLPYLHFLYADPSSVENLYKFSF
jgi:hypothetical protein